jgi:hypothetical protein
MNDFKKILLKGTALCVCIASLAGCAKLLEDADRIMPEYKSLFSVIYTVKAYDSNTPVTGGSWRILGTQKSGSISSDGTFIASDLTEGRYTVQVWADNYAVSSEAILIAANAMNGTAQVQLQETANQLNEAISLYPTNATADIKIYKGVNGGLATRVAAHISFLGLDGETVYLNPARTGGFTTMSVTPRITAVATGNTVISGAPAYTYIYVDSLPYDSNMDGKYEYRATNIEQLLLPWSQTGDVPVVLNLDSSDMLTPGYPNNKFYVEQTNIDVDNSRITGDTVYFIFTDDMNTEMYRDTDYPLITVSLQDGSSNDEPVTFNWVTARRLEISPIADELDRSDNGYDLMFTVHAADGRKQSFNYMNYNWDVTRVSPVMEVSDYITNLMFNPATTTVNFNDHVLPIQWDALVGADSYDVYIKDNHMNSSWLYYSNVSNNDDDVTGSVSTTVTLPAKFDYYDDDTDSTAPFMNGVTVSITVVPHNWATPNMMDSSVPMISISDVTGPQVVTANAGQDLGTGDAGDNSGGTVVSYLYFKVKFTTPEGTAEPIMISNPPTIAFEAPAGAVQAANCVWHWGPVNGSDDTDRTQGYYKAAVSAGVDSTLGGTQRWKFVYTNVTDTNGNSVSATYRAYSDYVILN